MTAGAPLLSARDLSLRFGPGCPACVASTGPAAGTTMCPACRSVLACHGVSLDLFPEEVLGVVGESGSGKSSLLRMLHLEAAPTSGTIRLHLAGRLEGREAAVLRAAEAVEGRDLCALSPFLRRQTRNLLMGMVHQNPHLGLRLDVSAGGNVAEKLLMSGWRAVGAMRSRTADLLGRVEIPLARMDHRPRSFSGGMQQRVQIAKALSTRPVLLLLDELTTGLDVSVQARVLDLVRALQREFRVAMVVVSHDLGVIRTLTTRTLVIKDGRVVEAGLTDQVLEDPQHPYTQLMVSSIL